MDLSFSHASDKDDGVGGGATDTASQGGRVAKQDSCMEKVPNIDGLAGGDGCV